MSGEPQLLSMQGVANKGNPAAEKNRFERQFDAVYQAGVQQPSKHLTAPEQPYILLRVGAQASHSSLDPFANDRHAWIVGLPKRRRQDDRTHTRDRRSLGANHRLERSATNEQRIELCHQCEEVGFRIRHDPIGLAVRPSNVSVEAHGCAESDSWCQAGAPFLWPAIYQRPARKPRGLRAALDAATMGAVGRRLVLALGLEDCL